MVERYDYDDFGSPAATSSVGNPFLFGGRRYDADTRLYYLDSRYLDPAAGRFISRDPLGVWGDSENMGNASMYSSNNPWSRSDPTGEAHGCGPDLDPMITDRQQEAEGLARRAYDYLARRSGLTRLCDRRYRTWFGLPTSSRWNIVERRYADIRDRLGRDFTVNCSNTGDCQGNLIFGHWNAAAYVSDNCSDNTVYLCSKFFHIGSNTFSRFVVYLGGYHPWINPGPIPFVPTPMSNLPEEQAGLLVHEMSHCSGTQDYAYSVPWCKGLAIVNPSAAVNNADNYDFFARYHEGGGCLGLRNAVARVIRATREAIQGAGRFAARAEKKAAQAAKNTVRKAEDAAKRVAKKIRKRLHH